MSCGNCEVDQKEDVCNIHDICCQDRLEKTQGLYLLEDVQPLVEVKTVNDRESLISMYQ